MVVLSTSSGFCFCSRPLIICVLPVPAGPASMMGLLMPTSSCIQKVTEPVSGVGTVTCAMGVVLSYSMV